jgi:hypothetical protein
MILGALHFNVYIVVLLLTFFLVILDSIVTYVNAKVYNNYYIIELLPWNRIIYKKLSGVVAFILSFVFNLALFISLFLVRININFMFVFTGFMIYRTTNSIVRFVQYWRVSLPRE